jgi:hypothetical protein
VGSGRLIVDYPSPVELAKDDPWLLACLAGEDDPVKLIVVPTALSRPSPVLVETIEAVAAEKRGKRGLPNPSGAPTGLMEYPRPPHIRLRKSAIGIRVSLPSADRALLLMDTLVKACIKRGLTVSIEKMHLAVGHDGTSVHVRISERVTKIVGSLKGLSKLDVLHDKHVTYRATGELAIAVARLGSERKTVDIHDLPLEQQLGVVVSKIYRGIAEVKAWRAHMDRRLAESEARANTRKAEQEARQAAVAEVKRIEEDGRQRQVDLIAEANAWQQSKTISAYAEHLAAEATASGDPISAELKAWLEWATNTAQGMDPTSKRVK